jgi:hypothetical protein
MGKILTNPNPTANPASRGLVAVLSLRETIYCPEYASTSRQPKCNFLKCTLRTLYRKTIFYYNVETMLFPHDSGTERGKSG